VDIVSRLRSVELFRSLSEENLLRLASLVRRERRLRGDRLFYQGEILPRLYILESGEAVARAVDPQGIERPVNYFRAGQYFGENSLFIGEPRDVTVEITADADVLYIDKADLDRLLEEHPEIWSQLRLRPEVVERLYAPRFDWQSENEATIFFSQRHWFILLQSSVKLALALILLWSVLLWLSMRSSVLSLFDRFGVSLGLLWLTGAVFSAAIVVRAIWDWVDWRNDYYVVTTRRVVRREKVALTYESRDEAPLDKIQNINIQRNPFQRILGYGDLIIETAGTEGIIRFDALPNPEKARDLIFEQVNRVRAWERAQAREQIRQELAHRLGWRTAPPETERESVAATAEHRTEGLLARILGRFHPFRLRIERDGAIIWRKHWIVLLRSTFLPGLLSLLLAWLTLLAATGGPPFNLLPGRVPLLAFAPLWIVILGWLAWQIEDWRNDLYMVTPERIVDMEALPFGLNESRREGSLGMIQNVRFTRPGPLATLLNYGNVVVETAGATGDFTFEFVANPSGVQRDIFNYIERFRQSERQREAARRKAEFSEWISIYHELRERNAGQEKRHRLDRQE